MKLPYIILLTTLTSLSQAKFECCFLSAKKNEISHESYFNRVAESTCNAGDGLGPKNAIWYRYGGPADQWTSLCAGVYDYVKESGKFGNFVSYKCHKYYNKKDGVAGSCTDVKT